MNKQQAAGRAKRMRGGKRWLGSCSVAWEHADTLSLRWRVLADGFLTVPLRSVSVAWTSRMSPDPARTSGPSSFWEGGGVGGQKQRSRWATLGLRAERQSESKVVAGWRAEWRRTAPLLLLLPLNPLNPLSSQLSPAVPSDRLPNIPPSCTSSYNDREASHARLWLKLQHCHPSVCWNTSVAVCRLQRVLSVSRERSSPSLSPSACHSCFIGQKLARLASSILSCVSLTAAYRTKEEADEEVGQEKGGCSIFVLQLPRFDSRGQQR